jgi:hypothetical protein
MSFGTDRKDTAVCRFGSRAFKMGFIFMKNSPIPMGLASLTGMEAQSLLRADMCGRTHTTSPPSTITLLLVEVIL